MMGTSYFTVFDGVDVVAADVNGLGNRIFGPSVLVTAPDGEWELLTAIRPFASLDKAKAAGREIAAALKEFRPEGYAGFLSPRLSARRPELVVARAAIEAAVRRWAAQDPESLVRAMNS